LGLALKKEIDNERENDDIEEKRNKDLGN